MSNEFRKENLKEWDRLLLELFNGHIPESFVWNKKEDIVDVLKHIGRYPNTTHTFLPTGGGSDLIGAEASVEPGCIELHFSQKSAGILKPKTLIFQSFGEPYEWAYFRIETEDLAPSGVYENLKETWEEELTEISPGEYKDRFYWDEGYYKHDENGKEIALPKTARVVIRFFSGSFVIFANSSSYNMTLSTYDGRHSKMTSDEFRQHIDITVKKLKREGEI